MAFLWGKSKLTSKVKVVGLFKPTGFRYASIFTNSDTIPSALERSDEELIIKRPWATLPFISKQDLSMPIFNLINGEFTGEVVNLDKEIFNLPLRRDLIHNAFYYFRKLGYRTYKTTKTKGTTAGSGKKPFPQKGRGMARQGNKRSPHLKKGGKAHGRVPQDYTIEMNAKQMQLAFKT